MMFIRHSLFESSDIASNQTANSGYELSNPSSSAGFNFIYTSDGWIRCSSRSKNNIMISTNQAFIEFQTRAIFIFEQSQVGCAMSEPRPGSSPLCAIRATVVSTRHSPLVTSSTQSHPPSPSLFPPFAPWVFA